MGNIIEERTGSPERNVVLIPKVLLEKGLEEGYIEKQDGKYEITEKYWERWLIIADKVVEPEGK